MFPHIVKIKESPTETVNFHLYLQIFFIFCLFYIPNLYNIYGIMCGATKDLSLSMLNLLILIRHFIEPSGLIRFKIFFIDFESKSIKKIME